VPNFKNISDSLDVYPKVILVYRVRAINIRIFISFHIKRVEENMRGNKFVCVSSVNWKYLEKTRRKISVCFATP
jgi:hypothetical protein